MPRSLTPSAIQALIQLQDVFYRRKLDAVRQRDALGPGSDIQRIAAAMLTGEITTWDAAYAEISKILASKGLRNPS